MDEQMTLRDFMDRLEEFLAETLDEASRGNVFLSKAADDKVCLNMVLGAPFASADEEINQINMIILPTDRSVLGAQGVSLNDYEETDLDEDFEDEDYDLDEDYDEEEYNLADSGEAESIHSAFDHANKIL